MPNPLFTHTDLNDTRLTVTDDIIGLVAEGEGTITTHIPTGEEAVRLARAILAAAGDTGHKVFSAEEIDQIRLASELRGAVSMRERALAAIQPRWDLQPEAQAEAATAIRTLPLLPDGDTENTVEVRNGLRQVLRTDPAPEPQSDAERHDPTACTDLGCLACRVAQLESDMRRQERHTRFLDDTDGKAATRLIDAETEIHNLTRRLGLLEVAQGRVDRLHDRVDALEDAARERDQAVRVEEYRYCGVTIDRPDGATVTCARRVAHEGECGPRRDT